MVWPSQGTPGRSSSPLTLDSLYALMATVEEVKEEDSSVWERLRLTNLFTFLLCLSVCVSEIILPGTYKNSVRGLCGNYDGITRNEYMKPDGTVVRDLKEFGDSWKVNDRPANRLRILDRPIRALRYDYNQAHCFYRFLSLFNREYCC